MKSQLLSTVLAGAVLGSACGQVDLPPAAPSESTRQEIIGGTVTMGDPAVVALVVGFGGRFSSYCTGSLIGPKTVLTAAHCIYAQGQNAPYSIAFGTYASNPSSTVRVVSQTRHPAYGGQSNDFGLLRLERAVTNVPFIRLNETPLTQAMLGTSVRHSGFGVTDGASQIGGGTKREVATPLRRVMATSFESGAPGKQTCQGDSGGPGFMKLAGSNVEKVVGVVSYGDQNCAYQGYDGRVDVGASWIRTTMGAWEAPTCDTDGQCVMGCVPVDQDCVCKADGVCGAECTDPAMDPDCPRDCAQNGVCAQQACGRPDVDCVLEGQRCDAAVQCRDRLCVNDAQNPVNYCSKPCAQSADCPASMECNPGSRVCQVKQRPVRQLFDSCYAASDFCTAGICTGPVGGLSRCVVSCVVQGDCPSGSTCEAGADSRRYCRPANVRFTAITVPALVGGAVTEQAAGCSASGGVLIAWLGVALLRRRRR